jgi:two-component system response regulator GlrR
LRQRLEDIPLLTNHFLDVFNRRFAKEVKSPSPSLLGKMMAYSWPGNVRELQNSLERSVVLSINGEIDEQDLFAHLSYGTPPDAPNVSIPVVTKIETEDFELPLTEAKQAFERRYLEHHHKGSNGQVLAVAEKSGRYRADIYRLLLRYEIDPALFRK